MISQISDFLYSFKTKTVEAQDIASSYNKEIEKFVTYIKEEKLEKEYEENFLTILGYSLRLEDVKQRLFYTFQEAVYAVDLDKLMRNEDSLRVNSIVYTKVLDLIINEFNGNPISSELKEKSIDTYKKIEERKAKENKKYHMYQN